MRYTDMARLRLLTLGGAAALALSLTGCGGSSTPSKSTSPRPRSASPTDNSPEGQARRQIEAAYNGYVTTYVADAATANYQDAKLKDYTGDPLTSEVVNNLYQLNTKGMVYAGRPSWHPKVTSVALDSNPRKATIVDCFDATNWNAVYKSSSQSAGPTGQAKRYTINATAQWYTDRWLIITADADRSKTC